MAGASRARVMRRCLKSCWASSGFATAKSTCGNAPGCWNGIRRRCPTYTETAQGLGVTQRPSSGDLTKIQGENPVPALEFPLQDIVDSMQGVEGLLQKPQTDRTTDLAQTKTIEQLSDIINVINEQQQKSQGSSSSPPNSNGRGHGLSHGDDVLGRARQGGGVKPERRRQLAGGTADRAISSVNGDPNAKNADGRTMNRASGITTPTSDGISRRAGELLPRLGKARGQSHERWLTLPSWVGAGKLSDLGAGALSGEVRYRPGRSGAHLCQRPAVLVEVHKIPTGPGTIHRMGKSRR